MASSGIGLKDYHEVNIVNFLRFARTQRDLSLRTISSDFDDIKKESLENETTFTVHEVEELINDLWERTRDEIDTELTHQSHTFVLLLRQLFLQAEHWHLRMQVDTSELQNKELLDSVKNFEEEQFSSDKKQNTAPNFEPINDTGGTVLLREEIERLNEENKKLKDKVRYLEQKVASLSELRSSHDSFKISNDDVDDLERQIANLRNDINKGKDSNMVNEKALESEMINAKHRYLKVLEQLKLTETELEKKFNQTNAYKNMKQILEKKNEQLKMLKKRLEKYEPDSQE